MNPWVSQQDRDNAMIEAGSKALLKALRAEFPDMFPKESERSCDRG